jgi:hypothetical protein
MPHQVDQHVENLRLDVGERALAIQLAPAAVDLAILEGKLHGPPLQEIQTFSGEAPAFVQDTRLPAAAGSGS